VHEAEGGVILTFLGAGLALIAARRRQRTT
jgi:MYXO-CTERM domain-containing protein